MKKYRPTFGIEIHAALDTITKAFSPAENIFDAKPNTKVHPVDLGYPGCKPTVNRKMIQHSIRLAKSLDMEIEDVIYFDRKNYFYPDLALGYQITQYFKPIGRNGKLKIFLEDGREKDITITEIHMEQDTAKQTIKDGKRLFDFNRAGAPLIEIVSGHEELESIDEVIAYVKQMREQLVVLGISRAILAEGTFRVDVNVSVSEIGSNELGTRTELKNLNSFENIKIALEYEINHQIETIEKGGKVEMVTKRFDKNTNSTIMMREKNPDEYNFIPEGNINPIKLRESFINETLKLPTWKHYEAREEILKEISIDEYEIIIQSGPLFNFFLSLRNKFDSKQVSRFITQILISKLKSNKKFMTEKYLNLLHADLILDLINKKKITNKDIHKVIELWIEEKEIKKILLEFENKEQMNIEDIKKIIESIINENENLQEDIKNRPDRAQKFIMGQLMKKTKGQVNPKEANQLISNILKENE